MKKIITIIVVTLLLTSCGSSKNKRSTDTKLSGPQVTSSARELVRITNDVVAEFQPCLSPDGKKLLYVIRDDANSGNGKWSIRLKNDVMLPGFTPLIGKKTGAPTWINDDGDFMFTYYSTNPIIATSNIKRLGITYVGQNAYGDYDNSAMASPNGEKIVLTTSLQGERSICLVNRDGSSFTVLSEGINPKWHPNGTTLLYSKLSGDYFQLFELDLNTYQSTQITTGESHYSNGAYSPDGKHITFIANKDDKFGHLFLMKRNGRSVTQLTSGESNETQPFWGTDGYIYFASTAGAKRAEKEKSRKRKDILNLILSGKTTKGLQEELGSYSYPYSDIWRVKPLIVQ
ncbi:MAG: hypothetical protein COA67_00400 [Lutibacter sp.]|nr:MAG: hypothetical protein COA67_00400 [Lutibacter sp.]